MSYRPTWIDLIWNLYWRIIPIRRYGTIDKNRLKTKLDVETNTKPIGDIDTSKIHNETPGQLDSYSGPQLNWLDLAPLRLAAWILMILFVPKHNPRWNFLWSQMINEILPFHRWNCTNVMTKILNLNLVSTVTSAPKLGKLEDPWQNAY